MSFSVKKDVRVIVTNGGSSGTGGGGVGTNYWSLNGSNINNNNGGNVGINISNPQAILDVSGQTIIRTPNVRIGVDAGMTNQGASAIAIGLSSGQTGQNDNCIAIGSSAGRTSQNFSAIAIGTFAGGETQGNYTTAIGLNSGRFSQKDNAVSIGYEAGYCNQGSNAIAIGLRANESNSRDHSIAIGTSSGAFTQGCNAIAIGSNAGNFSQQSGALAIGTLSGKSFQGTNAISIGYRAGESNQQAYSIVIDASGTGGLNGSNAQACYIRPIRSTTGTIVNGMVYDPVNFEIRYDTGKTFVISHPLDNDKYLIHACLEGPEAGVYYRGTSSINDNENSVEISLPDYVSYFSNEFTVHVTSHSNTTMLSTTKIKNNKFTVERFDFSSIIKSEYINNSKSLEKVEFSWLVFAKRHSINVEPTKSSVVIKGDGPYKYIE
jgi:hypothetical protein